MKVFSCLAAALFFTTHLLSQNIGIGTTTPADKLHVIDGKIRLEDVSYPWLSFVNGSALRGFIGAEGVNMRVGTWPTNTTGNLYLRTNGVDRLTITPGGNIGIVNNSPDVKLHILGGTNAAPTGGGYLQLGSTTGLNVGFDNDEIQSRNNGDGSNLYLNYGGGQIWLGPKIIVTEQFKLYRSLPLSSNADLLPIAYGKVNSSGTVLSGTGNFYVQRLDAGEYRLGLLAEANVYTNRNLYTILVTPVSDAFISVPIAICDIQSDNSLLVTIAKPNVNYSNSGCAGDGCLTSLILNVGFTQKTDCGFSILIYKQ